MENAAIIAPHFQDPEKAREFLESKRWPNGPECPHCGVVGEAYRLTADLENKKAKTHTRKGVWKCAACREQFTVTVGTIMEDSHIPLNKWLLAFHLLCASKKGMSAHQLHRMLGVTYKSAWFMAHRIRYAMTQEPLSSKLGGVVEIDETYVGGKFRKINKWQQREAGQEPKKRANPVGNKAAVVSVLQRNGRVQSMHVERVTAENLQPIVQQMVCESAHIMTDSSTVLGGVTMQTGHKHDQVNHTEKEYVRYEDGICITTNSVEGYFATLKRGINGVYHHVGKHHLHRYLSEFDFRYNAREVSDVERRNLCIAQVGGKRLKYRDSCKKRQQAEGLQF
ncbi:MAG TPA: IS1595 family transposase [Bryobacteraceae bacterium]|nr:IS1595 family transposase [Bryobacteraceae bacterium]